MITIKYFNNNKSIGKAQFKTIDDAKNNLEDSDFYHKADRFEIIDEQTGDILDESEIQNNHDIIDDMFDGEDSKEGFDWTLGS